MKTAFCFKQLFHLIVFMFYTRYRGRVEREITEEEYTVEIKLVDEGGFEIIQYSPSNVKALPSQLQTVGPFVSISQNLNDEYLIVIPHRII